MSKAIRVTLLVPPDRVGLLLADYGALLESKPEPVTLPDPVRREVRTKAPVRAKKKRPPPLPFVTLGEPVEDPNMGQSYRLVLEAARALVSDSHPQVPRSELTREASRLFEAAGLVATGVAPAVSTLIRLGHLRAAA